MMRRSNNLRKNLLHLRKLKKLTQQEMEQRLGYTRNTWSNYEIGISEPSLDSLIIIASFFAVTVNELVLDDLAKIETTDFHPHHSDDTIMIISTGEFNYLKNELERLLEEVEVIKNHSE